MGNPSSRGCAWALAAVLGLGAVQAAAVQEYDEAARRARARAEALEREARELATRERSLLGDLRRLEATRQARAADLVDAEALSASAEAAVLVAESRAATLARDVEAARPQVAARLRRLYTRGRFDAGVYWLGAASVRDAARASRMLATLAARDQHRIASFARDAAALQAERAALSMRAREAAGLRARAAAARDEAARAAAAHARLLGEVAARRDLAEQLARELVEAQAALQAAIANMGPATTPHLVLPLRPFQGTLQWPAPGAVTRRFGRAREARFGTAIIRNGIEIATAEGQPVRAIHEGRVAFAGTFIGFGHLVIVDHGQAALSLYGHMASAAVRRGDRVEAGSTLGDSGRSPAGVPALYFELRVDGRPVDPLQWLASRPNAASR